MLTTLQKKRKHSQSENNDQPTRTAMKEVSISRIYFAAMISGSSEPLPQALKELVQFFWNYIANSSNEKIISSQVIEKIKQNSELLTLHIAAMLNFFYKTINERNLEYMKGYDCLVRDLNNSQLAIQTFPSYENVGQESAITASDLLIFDFLPTDSTKINNCVEKTKWLQLVCDYFCNEDTDISQKLSESLKTIDDSNINQAFAMFAFNAYDTHCKAISHDRKEKLKQRKDTFIKILKSQSLEYQEKLAKSTLAPLIAAAVILSEQTESAVPVYSTPNHNVSTFFSPPQSCSSNTPRNNNISATKSGLIQDTCQNAYKKKVTFR